MQYYVPETRKKMPDLPVILVTPPSVAAAPTIAYKPGVMHLPAAVQLSKKNQSGCCLLYIEQ